MYQFFVSPEQIAADKAVITGSDVNHIVHVLRMKPGEVILVNDGTRTLRCRIDTLGEEEVRAAVEAEEASCELPCRIYLFQGLPKADKLENIIQKSVELGVYQVIPVSMKRCVARLDEKKQETKRKRWQAIAESAAKQAKRSLIPEIGSMLEYREALKAASDLDVFLLPYEHADGMERTRRILSEISPGSTVGILIGPEGGFDEEEVSMAEAAGAKVVTLGRRILRTETAGPALLAMLDYCLEE